MTATNPSRPDTIMGRALAARALTVAETYESKRRTVAKGMIDLTVPESVPAPEHVREAAKDALDRGETHYTSRPGITELREAIAERSTAEGIPATADQVVITNGGSEALYVALQCVVNAGDKVAIIGPVAPNVIEMIEFIGGTVVHLTGDESGGFYPGVDEFKGIDASTLLVTSPSPHTGRALSSVEIEQFVGEAKRKDAAVILDRSGAECLYEPQDRVFTSEELGSYPIVLGSFSNSYNMAGWRVGYFTASEQLMGSMRNLKQAMSICTTAVSQHAAFAAITGPREWLAERRAEYKRRYDRAASTLSSAGFPVINAEAFPSIMIDVRSVDGDDIAVASQLERSGVRVDPGSRFGAGTAGFIRVDLGVSEPTLWAGIDRIAGLNSERSN